MRMISVPARAKALNALLKKARRRDLVLQASDGRLFVLSPVEEWRAFKVGEDLTRNKELMKFLAERRTKGKHIPLEQVKAELGIP